MSEEKLTSEQVLHLARLSRLGLTAAEIDRFTRELGQVLAYVAQLQELAVSADEVTRAEAVLRADEVVAWPRVGELVAQAPEHTATHLSVPAVFEERN